MDIKADVKAVEAEVVKVADQVESAVVNEAEKIKASLAAQKADFVSQLEKVKTEMGKLQQQFELLKTKGVKLEGAIESLDILSNNVSK